MPLPSVKQRKESIVRVVLDLKKVLNINAVVIEQGQFDVSSMRSFVIASFLATGGKKLVGKEYQESEYQGRNTRAKVLWRDNYTCQRCGSKEEPNTHHIKRKIDGGTDTLKNLITLCKKCHDELHKGVFLLDKKPGDFKYPSYLMQGKHYIFSLLESSGLFVTNCFGWQTSLQRKQISIEKSHSNDAIAMVTISYMPTVSSLEYTILPKRAKVWEDNPTKQSQEKLGFKHYDLVKARHRTKGNATKGHWVIGSVRALKAKVMTLRTKENDNFPVSYRKSFLLQRFNRIIYYY